MAVCFFYMVKNCLRTSAVGRTSKRLLTFSHKSYLVVVSQLSKDSELRESPAAACC